MAVFSEQSQLNAIVSSLTHMAHELDLPLSVRLWDGRLIPMGTEADPDLVVSLRDAGTVGALIRRPTAETLLRLYATGSIDFEGANLVEFREALRMPGSSRKKLKSLNKGLLLRNALPFLFAKPESTKLDSAFSDDSVGRKESKRDNQDYIQFHYDVGNEFYQLFLDPEMLYSCGYFHTMEDSLAQAQINKLDMICRKLRLQPEHSMLDIGCGWGGLICYAARHYGVRAHGITLSQRQYEFAKAKIERLGLSDRVTVEICDYALHEGSYDRISSIGMSEHIGVANYPRYFRHIHRMLRERGVFLNHALARSAKRTTGKARRIRPERRLLLNYIFPGSELTSVGFTSDGLEQEGFEVHDVEAWREHYALTCRAWCERLTARREEAIELIGKEKYRVWVAYLAGASCGLADGGMKIYQVVATKLAKGPSGMPLTRSALYTGHEPPRESPRRSAHTEPLAAVREPTG